MNLRGLGTAPVEPCVRAVQMSPRGSTGLVLGASMFTSADVSQSGPCAAEAELDWTTSAAAVLQVQETAEGRILITGVSTGGGVVRASLRDGPNVADSIQITVVQPL